MRSSLISLECVRVESESNPGVENDKCWSWSVQERSQSHDYDFSRKIARQMASQKFGVG